jgi:hypothetical protein
VTEIEQQDVENRYYALLAKVDSLTDEDMHELRILLSHPTSNMRRPHILAASQLRLGLDLIDSIRRFDRASSDLVTTTNRLTIVAIGIAVVGLVIAIVSLVK